MAFPWIAVLLWQRWRPERGKKNVLGLLREIPALSEELLSFGAAVGSPGWSLGIFSLKTHFLLAQPGFFPAERTESALIFRISRLWGLWSVAGTLLPTLQ